jgi:hypothetical protein
MPFADSWALKVSRQPDETGDYNEGLDRKRTAIWELVIDPDHYGVESGLFLLHSALPKYLDSWVSSDGLTTDTYCVARTARIRRGRGKSPLTIEYNYSTMAMVGTRGGQLDPTTSGGGSGPGQHGTGSAQSPADLAPNIQYGFESFETALLFDFSAPTDTPPGPYQILNAAKRYPKPLPNGQWPILVMTVTRWERYYPRDLFFSHGHTVNADLWNDFLPFTVYHLPLTSGPRQEFGGVWWHPIQYVFKATPVENGWDLLLPSYDTHELNPAGKPVPILDPLTGHPTSEEWPLDAAGHAIRDLTTTAVFKKQYHTVERADFDLFTIDLTGEFAP